MTGGTAERLRPLVGNLRQAASVRRIVLDDGPERGVRALAFSTGGGLDFWVLADRSLDIGPLSWQGVQIGWQNAAGFRSPSLIDADGDGGRGFDRGFSGFLVTCGLDHIRKPANGHPLHGRLPFTPARLTAYGEDWDGPEPKLFCEGEVVQSRYGGEALRLRRRIEAPVGGSEIRITDTVENLAAETSPQEMLYHFNIGFPAVDSGTRIVLDGEVLAGGLTVADPDGYRTAECFPAGVAPWACCLVQTETDNENFEAAFRFSTTTLGWLQLWRDLRPNAGVLSVEPCTSASDGATPLLGPGESRSYSVAVSFAGPAPLPFSNNWFFGD